MRVKVFVAAASAAGLLCACTGPQYHVETAPTITVPRADAALGARTIAPDETLLVAPVGFAAAARLKADSVVSIIGRDFAFAQEETLPLARIAGKAAARLPQGAVVFCGRPNSNMAKNLLALSTVGVSSLLSRTGAETRVCFIDAERDEAADSALLVGVKSDADAAPVKIAPLAYSLVALEPMSGESEMRIIYRGETGLVGGSVSFDLEVIEQGNRLFFDNVRRKLDIAELPFDVTLMGAQFTVLSYDPLTGSAQIDVRKAIPASGYGLQSTYRTQYVPIYVPR